MQLGSAAVPAQQRGVHQTKQGTSLGIHGDRRMQIEAALVPIIAQRRRVLDREDMAAGHQALGMGGGGGDRFLPA